MLLSQHRSAAMLALAGTAVAASPGLLRAEEPGAGRSVTAVTRYAAAPSDTVTKLEKGKSDRAPAPRRKPLKSRAVPSSGGGMDPRLVPDQPWATEFYVENDLPVPSRSFARLAAYIPER